ncbi:hypothetical protein [Pseudonocardia sp.]|uniref:hypothetical protein n=1 Tax=Pseudonocardia sp. TaxID=60912 RepID=UPI0031FC6076
MRDPEASHRPAEGDHLAHAHLRVPPAHLIQLLREHRWPVSPYELVLDLDARSECLESGRSDHTWTAMTSRPRRAAVSKPQ